MQKNKPQKINRQVEENVSKSETTLTFYVKIITQDPIYQLSLL